MVEFIEGHRVEYGIEPICTMLPITPSTYYKHAARKKDPKLRSDRAKRDNELQVQIRRVWHESFGGVYGAEKVRRQLVREGTVVARCTVERLMRRMGLRGAVQGRAYTA